MNEFKIYDGFINRYQEKFDNIRHIAFKLEETYDFGKLQDETIRHAGGFFDSYNNAEEGVYIFQTDYDENKALRIFKDFRNPKQQGIQEDRLVSILQGKQSFVQNTDFPTGIVTLDGRIIGQEIIFYPDSLDIYEYYTSSNKNLQRPTEIYLKVIKNLKELFDNGVAYLDIHYKNFMVLPNGEVKVIDFEKMQLNIDEIDQTAINRQNYNLRIMIKKTNELTEVSEVLGRMPQFKDLNEAYEIMQEWDDKLKRIRK